MSRSSCFVVPSLQFIRVGNIQRVAPSSEDPDDTLPLLRPKLPLQAYHVVYSLGRRRVMLLFRPGVRLGLMGLPLLILHRMLLVQGLLEVSLRVTPADNVHLGRIIPSHEVVVDMIEPLVDVIQLLGVDFDELLTEAAPEIVDAMASSSEVLELHIDCCRVGDVVVGAQVSVEL